MNVRILNNRLFYFRKKHWWMRPIFLFALLLLLRQGIAQNTDPTSNCFPLTASVKMPSCTGFNDGQIVVNLASPNAAVTYEWLNAPSLSTTNAISNLPKGEYKLVISDGVCKDTLTFPLNEPPKLEALIADTAICAKRGFVNLARNVRGGTGAYQITANSVFGTPYNCNNCPSTQTLALVDTTSFLKMQVKDQNGCIAERNIFVELLDSLKTNFFVKDETCTRNGAITVRATGGSGNYLYALNSNATLQQSPVFRELKGDSTYIVNIKDLKGCPMTDTILVKYRPEFTPATLRVRNVTCKGFNDGLIEIQTPTDENITGYALSGNGLEYPLQNAAVFTNLLPGNYKARVQEGEDCYVVYPFVIKEPAQLQLSTSSSDANCPGSSDGSVEMSAQGGNGGYQYSIDGTTFQARRVFFNLSARPLPYVAIVRDSLGCTTTSFFLINEPEAPPISADVTASCPEMRSGSIVILEGGKLLYGDYEFSLDSINWQQENLFEGLASGTYTVFVRYPDGCVYKVTAIVPEVEAPGVFFRIQDVSCPGGTDGAIVVEITMGGETDDYEYSLDGENFIEKNGFKNLSAGAYSIFLRDSLGCIFVYPFTINEPEAPELDFNIRNVSCFGDKDGQVVIIPEGGLPPFSYALGGIAFVDNPVFRNLGAGTYLSLVRDANGCIYADTVVLQQPEAMQVAFEIIDETCGNDNGFAFCIPNGGTAPYHYFWSNGETTPLVKGLSVGAYTVTVVDKNGCKLASEVAVKNLPGPVLLAELTEIPCNGTETGAINLTVLGGSPPLFYKWSNGSRSEDIYQLSAGDYSVTVQDANQCWSTKAFNLNEPAPISLQSQTGTFEGLWFINLTVEGGILPYQFQWSNGATSEDLFNLLPGEYTVTVTDGEDCSAVKTINAGATGAPEPGKEAFIKLFPNPTIDQLQIIVNSPELIETKATVFAVNGQLVLPTLIFHENRGQLDLRNLPAAVYFVKIERESAVFFKKVVKQ